MHSSAARPSSLHGLVQMLLSLTPAPLPCACSEFVVGLISEWFIEAANHTCGDFDRGVDEMQLAGLTPVPSVKVSACGTCTAEHVMQRFRAHETGTRTSLAMVICLLGLVLFMRCSVHCLLLDSTRGLLDRQSCSIQQQQHAQAH